MPSKSHIKKSRQRVPPRCDATSNDSSQQPETRRVSKSGPSSSYTETWDGKYPMETQGMWDTSGIQGPSCFILPPLDVASKQDLEKVYAQAKNTYFSGQPIISDGMFDEIERRLRALGSDAAKKYPRCSRRDMKIYGDLESDNEQMKNLQNVWALFLVIGGLFVLWDTIELRTLLDGSIASNHSYRPPIFGALGFFLAQASLGKIKALRNGDVVAVAGDCPNCGERVFTFLPGNEGRKITRGGECHVCDRSISFRADVSVDPKSPYRRRATGRVYLSTRADDFFEPEGDVTGNDTTWPPRKKGTLQE